MGPFTISEIMHMSKSLQNRLNDRHPGIEHPDQPSPEVNVPTRKLDVRYCVLTCLYEPRGMSQDFLWGNILQFFSQSGMTMVGDPGYVEIRGKALSVLKRFFLLFTVE